MSTRLASVLRRWADHLDHRNAPMTEPPATDHRMGYDIKGWYCLDCSWPDSDLTYYMDDAYAHQTSTARV